MKKRKNFRFKKEVAEAIEHQAKKENRSENNLVETVMDDYCAGKIIKQIQDNNLTRSENEALKSTKNK